MKNIALKYANTVDRTINDNQFEIKIGQQIEWLLEIEEDIDEKISSAPFSRGNSYNYGNSYGKISNGVLSDANFGFQNQSSPVDISVSYLVVQHKKEMLEGAFDIKNILKQSFNAEFVYMLSNCMFEPLLSSETPDKN